MSLYFLDKIFFQVHYNLSTLVLSVLIFHNLRTYFASFFLAHFIIDSIRHIFVNKSDVLDFRIWFHGKNYKNGFVKYEAFCDDKTLISFFIIGRKFHKMSNYLWFLRNVKISCHENKNKNLGRGAVKFSMNLRRVLIQVLS